MYALHRSSQRYALTHIHMQTPTGPPTHARDNLRNRWARMAVRIQDFTIIDVAKPNLGEFRPSRVRADIKIDLVRCVFFLASFLDSSTFICLLYTSPSPRD